MNGSEVGSTTLDYLRGEKARRQFQDSGLACWMSNAQKRRVERFGQVVVTTDLILPLYH
jgi:hypothetical protein